MENNFAGKSACKLVLPMSLGKIEKSFSPKLTDYFIQGMKSSYPGLEQPQKFYLFVEYFLSNPF
jgi:hypothetical protein